MFAFLDFNIKQLGNVLFCLFLDLLRGTTPKTRMGDDNNGEDTKVLANNHYTKKMTQLQSLIGRKCGKQSLRIFGEDNDGDENGDGGNNDGDGNGDRVNKRAVGIIYVVCREQSFVLFHKGLKCKS